MSPLCAEPLKTHQPNLEKDYPLRYNKPVDAAYPPYVGGGTAEQHQLGLFQPLMDSMKKLKPAT